MTSPNPTMERLAIEAAITPRQAQDWVYNHLRMQLTDVGFLPLRHALVVMKALVDFGVGPAHAGRAVREAPPDGSGVWMNADPVLIMAVRY